MKRFDWITSNGAEVERPAHDLTVLENENFVVLPTLGSLVPGWLLIVPRRPMDNLSKLNSKEQADIEAIIVTLQGKLQHFGAELFLFEHGGHSGSEISCGVDQAHLHAVPLNFDLVDVATRQAGIAWRQLSNDQVPWSTPTDAEYLSLCRVGGPWVIGEPASPVSQWFRRLIACEVGKPSRWNYREYPELAEVERTAKALASHHG